MSIFARSTRAPLGNSPARMRRNRSRFSSTERSRNGLFLPGSVRVPRLTRISSCGLVVHIGLAGSDEVLGPGVELLEVVRGVVKVLAPVEAEPVHVALDGVDELLLLLGRIGVVEAQVAVAAELLGDAEIQADRLGVADVQIAVRLRRKPGDDLGVASAREVGLDDVADEVATRFCGFGCGHCLEIPFDPYMHAVLAPAGVARGARVALPHTRSPSGGPIFAGKRWRSATFGVTSFGPVLQGPHSPLA